jgi:protein SCO1/2
MSLGSLWTCQSKGAWRPLLLALGLLAGLFPIAGLFAIQGARASEADVIGVAGAVPPLELAMTDATTGQPITAADLRGKVVMLYFGYTQCPDVCPLTLQNLAGVLKRLGTSASDVRVLFVTVDPDRDTLPILKDYTAIFAPEILGLRGGANDLARLARRYRIGYSVSPASAGHPYEVTHSSAIYVFDRDGDAKLLIPSLATSDADVTAIVADLRGLLDEKKDGWLARLGGLF